MPKAKKCRIKIDDLPKSTALDISEEEMRNVTGGGTRLKRVRRLRDFNFRNPTGFRYPTKGIRY